jgi:hypothetical protein
MDPTSDPGVFVSDLKIITKIFLRVFAHRPLLFEATFQCCGYMTFWGGSGSGSADPCLVLMDPDPAIFVIAVPKMPTKKLWIRIQEAQNMWIRWIWIRIRIRNTATFTSLFKDKSYRSNKTVGVKLDY